MWNEHRKDEGFGGVLIDFKHPEMKNIILHANSEIDKKMKQEMQKRVDEIKKAAK